MALLEKENTVACRCPVEAHPSDDGQPRTDQDWMETHANAIASRILMPRETVPRVVDQLIWKHGFTDNEADLWNRVVSDLARFYDVSQMAARIRLEDLGFIKPKPRMKSHITYEIDYSEALREYR